ncbi:unnamed protein product [Prunus armeniaca]|uniref:Uncharacterized protein n=1 Tax=Prunus armeniaca TaxID=36596 RepID=A0A6J5XEK7_PRUAR|nr:hypothetical protein GBA52_016372 [Prunus armeniaca]CAB4309318.1 unnamed protein product [Prunus armeniaca]
MALLMSLVFSNTLRYYPIGSIERATAKNLSVVFETKWKEDMEKKPNAICHPLRKELLVSPKQKQGKRSSTSRVLQTQGLGILTQLIQPKMMTSPPLFIMPWIRSGLP